MIMAVLAKGLPISFVPKQLHISAMRYDMVNNDCGRQLAGRSALHTERILFEEQRPGRAPFAVITSLGSILTGIQLAMCFAVYAI